MLCLVRLGALTDLPGKIEALKQYLAKRGCQASEPISPKQEGIVYLVLSSDNGLTERDIIAIIKARGLQVKDHRGENDGFIRVSD